MSDAYLIDVMSKSFPGASRPALDGLSFVVPAGEVVAIIGPNGAGKTTLVKLMLGLLKPSSGSVLLAGREVSAEPGAASRAACYLPQQGFGRSLAGLSVREAVTALGRLKGMSSADAASGAERLIGRLALGACAGERLARLSGGQRRLAALAAVLIGDRSIAILDEPTNDLDAEARLRVWDVIGEVRRAGRTVVLVTHSVLEADRVVDRVVALADGRLVACAPLPALKSRLNRLTVDLWSAEPAELTELASAEQGSEVSAGGRRVRFVCGRERFEELAGRLSRAGRDSSIHWSVRTPTLEDVYFELSGAKR